jgi:uncharacterized protein (TIGR01777 family)
MSELGSGTVAIAGATGFIGTALAAACARDGIKVMALVRDTARAAERLPTAKLFPWDATKGPPPEAAFEGVDVVVNLIGESIGVGRWTEAKRKRIRDSRVVGTRALVDALRGLPQKPRLLISASAVGYYGDRGEQILTETAEVGRGFLAEVARDWEAEALRAQELGLRVVLLRNGAVLAKHGGMLHRLLMPFRLGIGGRLGSGSQWLPWIHLDDEIGLIRHAMSHEAVSGPLNAVAPEPVTNAEFMRALGEVLHRPVAMVAPAFALRLALGALADEVLLASQRAMPVRTLESGYNFRFPLLRAALDEALARTADKPSPVASAT